MNTRPMSNLKGSPKDHDIFRKAWRRYSKVKNHQTGYLLENIHAGSLVSSYEEATILIKKLTKEAKKCQ